MLVSISSPLVEFLKSYTSLLCYYFLLWSVHILISLQLCCVASHVVLLFMVFSKFCYLNVITTFAFYACRFELFLIFFYILTVKMLPTEWVQPSQSKRVVVQEPVRTTELLLLLLLTWCLHTSHTRHYHRLSSLMHSNLADNVKTGGPSPFEFRTRLDPLEFTFTRLLLFIHLIMWTQL